MAINEETLRLAKKLRIHLDATVNQSVRDLVKAWALAWDEIHDAWSEAMMDVAEASTDGRWPTPWEIARVEKAQGALLAANEQIAALAEFTGVRVTDAVGKAVNDVPGWQARLIASQLPKEAGTTAELVARFTRVDEYALGAIVERTTQQVTATTYRLGVTAQEQMRRALIRGVAVGNNPRRAAGRMVRKAEGAFNGGLTRALVIARTEILDAHRSGAAAAQFANADVLGGWVWQAELDSRTCPSCWAMHGSEHNLDEVGPNDHQQGRCARLPKTKTWAELGFDIDEPASLLPDAQGRFADLPRADQLTIMGPARLQLLDQGKVTFADLSTQRTTPGWRDSWAPTPTRDLLARAG